jgi:hypothetical protein
MLSLSTTWVTTTREDPDTGEEAAVAAAIRVHEWVQTNLRRLAAESALPGSDVGTMYQRRCCDIISTDGREGRRI